MKTDFYIDMLMLTTTLMASCIGLAGILWLVG